VSVGSVSSSVDGEGARFLSGGLFLPPFVFLVAGMLIFAVGVGRCEMVGGNIYGTSENQTNLWIESSGDFCRLHAQIRNVVSNTVHE